MIETREGARGTSVTQSFPWGFYVRARVLCTDGRVRATSRIAETADTFFSVPASVRVKGKAVSGYVTPRDEPFGTVYVFVAHSYGRNGALLPGLPADALAATP
jgi:hypothetical protein